jgi:hypothetical protein
MFAEILLMNAIVLFRSECILHLFGVYSTPVLIVFYTWTYTIAGLYKYIEQKYKTPVVIQPGI